MIGDLRGSGLMLGDAAFLSEENIAKCLKKKLFPILKPNEWPKRRLSHHVHLPLQACKDGIQVQGDG